MGDGSVDGAGEHGDDVGPPPPSRVPVLLAVGGVVATVGAGWLLSFRAAGAVLALTLAAAAVMRLVMPVARVGTLAVRSRAVDVATLTALALAVAFLAQNAPG